MEGEGEGEREQDSAVPSPEDADSSWKETKDRFVCKMLEEYYFKPAGRSINPETAFANMNQHIKEDLHRSVSDFFYPDCDHHSMNLFMRQQPISARVAKAMVDGKESRVYELYLTHILKELHRSTRERTQNEVHMYTEGERSLTAVLSWY